MLVSLRLQRQKGAIFQIIQGVTKPPAVRISIFKICFGDPYDRSANFP